MQRFFAIATTVLIALVLAMLPMPDWTIWLRPAWVLLVLIYWAVMAPNHFGMGTAWTTGLIVDLLSGTLLGEHALAYTIVIYLAARISIRLRMFPLLQQSICIGMFVLLYQFIIYCIQGFIGQLPHSHLYWLSAVTSTLLWPWIVVMMRDCQRWFQIA